MYLETNHKGYNIMCDWGYVAEKDSRSAVLTIDPEAQIHQGTMVQNLVRYSFHVKDKRNICSLDLSVNYLPWNSSELITQGEIAPQENLEQEIYTATLSAHSENPQYLDQVVKLLKKTLKWVDAKQDNPKMEIPMQMVLNVRKEMIDSEIARNN